MSTTFPSEIAGEPSSSPFTSLAPSKIRDSDKKRQPLGPRSPLHVLNDISTTGGSSSSSCNCTNISVTNSSDTSASIEAPRGCLRFLLSHSSSSSKTPGNKLKTSSKTPKCTPNVRPIKPRRSKLLKENIPERPRPEKPDTSKLQALKKNSTCLYRRQPAKKPSSIASKQSKVSSLAASCGNSVDKFASGTGGDELERQEHSFVREFDDKSQFAELNTYSNDLNSTPLRNLEIDLGLDCKVVKVEEENSHTGNSKTPPVQASVSPEIQCGSSVVSTVTPVCYGAGYVVSGVSDKRKCRPRGILIVGKNNSCVSKVKAIENFDTEEEDVSNIRDTTDSIISKAPSPIEASMSWLLSPCDEADEDQKENSENGSHSQILTGPIALRRLSSPLSVDALSPDVYCHSDIKLPTDSRNNSVLSISPNREPEFKGFLEPLSFEDHIPVSPNRASSCLNVILKEGGQNRYQINEENSPISIDSLSSENVIRTPQSDSSSALKFHPPWLNADSSEKHDLSSVSELLSLANLSPGSPNPLLSLADSSFQFDCLANSMSLNQFQKILDDQAFWNINSSSEDVLKSQMRVSWRDGLMNRIYEMDEFDSCRYLSDEEEMVDSCSIDLSDILQAPLQHNDCVDPIATEESGASKIVNDEPEAEKCKEMLAHQTPCSCAESFSTDGGGLATSGDSDWNLCYKNRLFDF